MVLFRQSTQNLDQDLNTFWSPFFSFKREMLHFLILCTSVGLIPRVFRTHAYHVILGDDHFLWPVQCFFHRTTGDWTTRNVMLI